MPKQLKLLSVLLTLFVGWGIGGTTALEAKTKHYWPMGIRLGGDIASLAPNYEDCIFFPKELSVSLDVAQLSFVGAHSWHYMPLSNAGQYFRIGAQYNMAPKTPNGNSFFWGGQIARNYTHGAMWYEGVVGVSVKVWGMIYAGGNLNYKFNVAVPESLESKYIGGWGEGVSERLRFNYCIYLRIPLR